MTKPNSKNNAGGLERLQSDPDLAFEEIYREYRESFLTWIMQKYGMDQESGLDIFQDAVVVLYRNVQNGKLVELRSSVKTYLYSIGKNMCLKKIRKESRHKLMPLNERVNPETEEPEFDFIESEITDSEQVEKAMANLKKPCKELLKRFYFYGDSYEDIVEKMNYSSVAVARTQKSRCLKYLSKLLSEK